MAFLKGIARYKRILEYVCFACGMVVILYLLLDLLITYDLKYVFHTLTPLSYDSLREISVVLLIVSIFSKYYVILHRYIIFFPILASFVIVFFIIKDANWTFGDDSHFWDNILTRTAIWDFKAFRKFSRFFPLAFLEYNMFIPFGNVPYAYLVWNAIKFLCVVFLFLKTLYLIQNVVSQQLTIGSASFLKNTIIVRMLVLASFLYSKYFYLVFASIYYPESSLMLLLGLFVYFHIKGYYSVHHADAPSHSNHIFAWCFGTLALYFKETVFSFLLVVLVENCFYK